MSGLVNTREVIGDTSMPMAARVEGRRRDDEGDSVVFGRWEPDMEVGAQRVGHLLLEPGADGLAGDPADDLADEVALGRGRDSPKPFPAPTRAPARPTTRCTSPSRPGPRPSIGSVQPASPAVWAMTWRTSTASLSAALNSGQYLATGA